MECRRTNPQSSLPTPPSHTPTYTNAIPMDSWSIFNPTGHPVRDTPTIPLVSLCVHRDAPAIPLGSLCLHRDAPPIKMPPSTFPPHPGFYVFILHILQETARLSVCARRSNLRLGYSTDCCCPCIGDTSWNRMVLFLPKKKTDNSTRKRQ